jgi:hypothetical protein
MKHWGYQTNWVNRNWAGMKNRRNWMNSIDWRNWN